MPSTIAFRPKKRLALFCDGTWVGRETTVTDAPASNIRQLADMVGEVQYKSGTTQSSAVVHPIIPHGSKRSASAPAIVAGYQEGVGLNRTFLDYIWDGATASAIGEECISTYRFIVENYTDEHEIWMFGFSRGAFTVRCVAGMINNCGIIRMRPDYTEDQIQTLCYEVFRTYRSDLPVDAPKSDECQRWKGDKDRVWQVKRPIRHLGLIDTVGALGIPRLNAGIGFDWSPFEFFDHQVSSVVQHVYHAPCLHDRLWAFQPCLIFPREVKEGDDDKEGKDKAIVHQRWFPGTHYDVGRMTFRFIRQSPANWLEDLIGFLPDLLSRTIFPNEVLSDLVLRWQVQGIAASDQNSRTPIIPELDSHIERINERIAFADPTKTGSGDIYGDVLNYAPGGRIWGTLQRASRSVVSILNNFLPRLGDNIRDLLGINTIIGILTATADRKIPGVEADIYPYTQQEGVMVQGQEKVFSVAGLANMVGENQWGKPRYTSRTFESFLLWREVFGGRRDV
ncbi:Mediator of RNA polymerase II transcription subunit 7 [Coniothyrium glycines]